MLTLFDYGPSANCLKVRVMLRQLGIEHERVNVDIFAGESRTVEYLALSPAARTPAVPRPQPALRLGLLMVKGLSRAGADRQGRIARSLSALAEGDVTRERVPSVTVVLATYNRPDALRAAIRSVLRQTRPDWRLMVIGDRCEPPTEEAVRSVQDARISYINLPVRFGEQGGPNSVGMALAETDGDARAQGHRDCRREGCQHRGRPCW